VNTKEQQENESTAGFGGNVFFREFRKRQKGKGIGSECTGKSDFGKVRNATFKE